MAKNKTDRPAKRASDKPVSPARSDVDAFLAQVRVRPATTHAAGQGRLIFAMDATMSRQPTWDRACNLQAEMFNETARIGGLSVQLVYFRGFRECRASRWVGDAAALADLMVRVDCRGGHTQIGRTLNHVRKEAKKAKVNAVVYVGDCMEENVDDLCAAAGELGLLGVPLFMFQEGHDPVAQGAFKELARLTGGAYCGFDASSVRQLRELLSAVAVYAAGGRKALTAVAGSKKATAKLLLEQLG